MIQHPTYTFQNALGEGGMATVWFAEHNTLHKPVAIKVLNKEFLHNENIRKRFLAEARNLFGMSHPNVVKVTDLIDQDDLVAFVMEYIEGQTLKDYLDKKGKLTDEEIRQLFSQMLDAVGYVHEQGLIHRDIKPSNFMISNKGVIKLLDFGIAKNTDTRSAEYTITGTTQNMGTPMYMSPEQVKSTKDVTAQSDIYSLGVLLWQMVMGKKPYDTMTLSTFELQTKIVTEPLPPTGTYWDSLLQKALQKDTSLRYRSISDFNYELKNANKIRVEADSTIVDNNVKIEMPIINKTVLSSNQISEVNNIKSRHAEYQNVPNKVKKPYFLIALSIAAASALIIFLIIYLGSNTGEAQKAQQIVGEVQNSQQKAETDYGVYKDWAAQNEAFLAENKEKSGVVVTQSGLQYEVIRMGTGLKPTAQSTVKVHYIGTTIDGTEFDSSIERNQPAEFLVAGLIPGWTEALQLMPVGSKFNLVIPQALAYGSRGAGEAIKPFSTLIFQVEFLEIVK